jgi:cell division protein FtsL
MHNDIYIMLIAIIAVLVVLVVVLIGYILNNQSKIDDKNDAIIQEMRENIQLRDELRNRLNRAAS